MTAPAAHGPDLVVQFLNTLDVEDGTDALRDEAAWAAWCALRSVEPGDLARSREARDALRTVVDGGTAPLAPVLLRLVPGPDGLRLAPGAGDALSAVLLEVATLTAAGELGRVKLCPADDCRWAFVDRSRNRSRTWCDMGVCGNRAKVRTFRARQQAEPSPPRLIG